MTSAGFVSSLRDRPFSQMGLLYSVLLLYSTDYTHDCCCCAGQWGEEIGGEGKAEIQ